MSKYTMGLQHVLKNKVVWYMVSRYATYAIQFVVSIIIAEKLGTFLLGVWGFVLLLINYFNIFNFGIPNSATVLMVQYKTDSNKRNNIEASSMFLFAIVSLFIFMIGVYYSIFGIPFFDKYQIGELFYYVCLIAILQHFTSLFSLISRVKGMLGEVAFSQSIIAILLLLATLCFKGSELLKYATFCYLFGNVLAIIVFIIRKNISFSGIPNKLDCKEIINKGKYLFIYNICFYLVFLSTKTIVGIHYTVEEFGYFTFAYILSNAVLLCLQAFTAVVFPKLINKMNSKNFDEVNKIISRLRICYVTFSHLLMYIAMIFFPLIIMIMPQYQDALKTINLMAMTLLLYANSFGYSTLLIAQNKEKKLSVISLTVLVFNVTMALFLSVILNLQYQYVVLATMAGYLLYSLLCVIYGKRILKINLTFKNVIDDFFPYKLLIPYIIALIGIVFNCAYSIFVVIVIFILLNISSLKQLVYLIKNIIVHPNIVDIQKWN